MTDESQQQSEVWMAKRRTKKFSSGDVFRIPLSDESSTIGQVVATGLAMNSVLCLFFGVRVPQGGVVELSKNDLIAVQFVTPELLDSGAWGVIRHEEVAVDVNEYMPYQALETRRFIGVDIIGAGIIRKFLNAYFGLAPWDNWADPSFLDGLLVRGAERPTNAILVKQSPAK